MMLRDSGHGITEQSLQFWHENKDKIGRVEALEASFEPLMIDVDDDETGIFEWNVEIRGSGGSIFLSGCNCGYGGEGPNGTATILAELGVPIDEARRLMCQKHIDLRFTGREVLEEIQNRLGRKFYRQVFEVEVLSEGEPLNNINLSDIYREIIDGCCSGAVKEIIREEVTADKIAELLKAQGSDPSFLLGEDEE